MTDSNPEQKKQHGTSHVVFTMVGGRPVFVYRSYRNQRAKEVRDELRERFATSGLPFHVIKLGGNEGSSARWKAIEAELLLAPVPTAPSSAPPAPKFEVVKVKRRRVAA